MRVIDAEELFNKVGKIVPCNTTHYKAIGEFMNMITNSPTVQPKQGEWIMERVWYTLQGIFSIDYQCSECGLKTKYTSAFCPQCGAKMKKNKSCRMCDDYAGDGMYCAKNYLVYDFSLAKDNCENESN